MYYAICISVLLATLFVVGNAGALAVLALGRPLSRALRRWPAGMRADLLFLVRMFPLAAALLVTFALVAPGFFLLEPTGTQENVGLGLGVLALGGLLMATTVAKRLAVLLSKNASIKASLLQRSRPIEGLGPRCYQVDDAHAMVAVAGMFRPRIFLSSDVVQALSAAELRAAVAHELAHVSAADNLKRLLLGVSRAPWAERRPDPVEQAWSSAAELAADERAAGTKSAALDLASALLKVARMKVSPAVPLPLMSHFIPVEATSELPARVEALRQRLEGSAQEFAAAGRAGHTWHYARLTAVLVPVVLMYLLSQPSVLAASHELLETIVR